MFKNIVSVFVLVLMPFVVGCASIKTTSYNAVPAGVPFDVVGAGEGITSQGYIFCIIPIGDPGEGIFFDRMSSIESVKKAVSSKSGDGIVNLVVEDKLHWWYMPFYCHRTVTAYGLVVKKR